MSLEARVFEIARSVIYALYEVRQGESYIWPLRFTAALVKRDGHWRFHQIILVSHHALSRSAIGNDVMGCARSYTPTNLASRCNPAAMRIAAVDV